MNNCYDSVLERNLNTGVPKAVSYLTRDLISQQVKTTKNQYEREHEKLVFYQEIDQMISKHFPDKKSIEELKSKIPTNLANGLNGYVFNPLKAFDRIITQLEKDGKQKEIGQIMKECGLITKEQEKLARQMKEKEQ